MQSIVIGVAGGTGSGKSTFTNRLKEEFADSITVIYYDNYYRSRDGISIEDRKKINYDHPDSLDTDLLISHLKQLKAGKSVECPTYDFSIHNRSDIKVELKPNKIIILDGILIFQNDELRNLCDIKIFVDVDADERILRRAIRDVKERGRDLDDIMKQYLETVKPMHNKYVEPTKAQADIVINGGKSEVAFDIIKTKIEELLNI